ncbi:MAG: vitamin K epoxide reductase family protein [Chloroflexaceae bacterium]|nr:vitamin K epoxide reductase family protein [Chloroflexaceae bacterium]
MDTNRSLLPRMGIVLLALFGLFDSLYLSLSTLRPEDPMYCPVGGSCTAVQDSPWSRLPPGEGGLPVAFIGVGGYLVLFLLGMIMLQTDMVGGRLSLPPTLLVVSSAGALFSLYLIAIQVFVIHSICFWCALSALFQWSIWGLTLFDWSVWRRVQRNE